MIQLLKAEYTYYRFSTTGLFLIFLVTQFFFITSGYNVVEKSYPALRSVMILAIVVLVIIRHIQINREKTDRHLSTLPVALNKIALIRFVFLASFWVILLSVFWISLLLLRYNSAEQFMIWDTISITGLVFTFVAIPLIYRDLNHTFLQKKQRYLMTIIYMLFAVLGYFFLIAFFVGPNTSNDLIFIELVSYFVIGITHDALGAIIVLCSGLVLLILSKHTFIKRKSYLS